MYKQSALSMSSAGYSVAMGHYLAVIKYVIHALSLHIVIVITDDCLAQSLSQHPL